MTRRSLQHSLILTLGLLGLAALSYGTLADKLGFFWDDWTILWTIHLKGSAAFIQAFAGDRPLLAWIYLITTPFIRESALGWQLFMVFARWSSSLALWWALRGIWPQKSLQTLAAAIFFLLYPGFQQGFIAITYSNVFFVLTIYLASWGLMIWGLRDRNRFWVFYPLSLICAAYTVFTAEHFFGLEALRPVWIWIVSERQSSQRRNPIRRLVETLKLWAPFAVIDAAFLVWRLSHPTPRAEITLFDGLRTDLPGTLSTYVGTISRDLVTSSLHAWGQVFQFSWLSAQSPAVIRQYILICLGAAVLCGALLFFSLWKIKDSLHDRNAQTWGLRLIFLGLFALLVGGIPIWPTNLRIGLFFPWDRFTLPMMLGAALLLVGIIELITIVPYQNLVLITILAGFGAGFHYHNALGFRKDWLMQRNFFWQLTWRIPGIHPGTILLTSKLPFYYDWDNSLTAPLNWIYAPAYQEGSLPYLIYNAEGRLSRGLEKLEASTRITEDLRSASFEGMIAQSIVGFYNPPGECLKIVDTRHADILPDKPRFFEEIVQFSDFALIDTQVSPRATLPTSIFGSEPDPDWCYYFEKADLARQNQDWEKAIKLAETAHVEEKAFTRKNAAESIPFVDAYLHAGNWEKAAAITLNAFTASEKMGSILCALWQTAEVDFDQTPEGQAAAMIVFEKLKCQEPGL